jgi:hypothetical protein
MYREGGDPIVTRVFVWYEREHGGGGGEAWPFEICGGRVRSEFETTNIFGREVRAEMGPTEVGCE